MKHEPLSFADFVSLYASVSRLPEVLNQVEFMRAVHADTPASVRESNGQVDVTLIVGVNADGSVRSLRAIVAEVPPRVTVRGIMLNERGELHR